MTKSRTLIKKIVYKLFGEKLYQRAYVRGKIKDIKNGANLEAEAIFLKNFIHPNSTVLDVGANYGHYTIEIARLANQGRVYAFEPVPFTYGVLNKVVNYFSLPCVILANKAVSDRSGEVKMTVPLLDFGAPNTGVAHIGNSQSANVRTVVVSTLKLDDAAIEGKIDFIKMDIEGHEPLALRGMQNLLLRDKPVILIEFSHACLKRAGFEPSEFANYLAADLCYRFAKMTHDKLEWVDVKNPGDGYYFLIPDSQKEKYKSIFMP